MAAAEKSDGGLRKSSASAGGGLKVDFLSSESPRQLRGLEERR